MIRSFAEWFETAHRLELSLAEVVERREVKETGVSREAVRKRIVDALDVMRRLKDRWDPAGILQPRSFLGL